MSTQCFSNMAVRYCKLLWVCTAEGTLLSQLQLNIAWYERVYVLPSLTDSYDQSLAKRFKKSTPSCVWNCSVCDLKDSIFLLTRLIIIYEASSYELSSSIMSASNYAFSFPVWENTSCLDLFKGEVIINPLLLIWWLLFRVRFVVPGFPEAIFFLLPLSNSDYEKFSVSTWFNILKQETTYYQESLLTVTGVHGH